jgi:hypothetical protein
VKGFFAVVVLALVLVAASATSASAAPSAPPSTAALQKQVTALQKQVKILTNIIEVNFVIDECLNAVIADTFQATFATIDKQFSGQTPPVSLFGQTQPVVDDKGACTAFTNTKVVRTRSVPATTAPFSSLAVLLAPSSFFLAEAR